MRAAAVLLVLLAAALAGCLEAERVPVRARARDFVVVDLAAWDAHGLEVRNASELRAVLAADVPTRLPAGWGPNATEALPPAVVAALAGAVEGQTAETPLVEPSAAYGNWSAERTIRAPREDALPREVLVPAQDARDGQVRWANATWGVVVLDPGGAEARVQLVGAPPPGTDLELPAYWNEHYQLWRSSLVELDATALRVRHEPVAGAVASVGGVAYTVGPPGDEAVADGNHPLADQRLRFRATLRDIAFPGSDAHPVAPEARLVDAATGVPFNLSELRGRAVLLDFFATWCVTCKQQAPILARAQEEFGERLAIVSVTIDPLDTPEKLAAFRAEVPRAALATWGRELPGDWTFAFDPAREAVRGFSVAGIPREVLLDPDGRVRGTSVGLHPWAELRAEVEAALAAA